MSPGPPRRRNANASTVTEKAAVVRTELVARMMCPRISILTIEEADLISFNMASDRPSQCQRYGIHNPMPVQYMGSKLG